MPCLQDKAQVTAETMSPGAAWADPGADADAAEGPARKRPAARRGLTRASERSRGSGPS